MTARLEREIEAIMAARLGRPCLFMPSGRLAVYTALRTLLEPGERILMSPLTDDVIFFTVLAAGLRPVMASVSADDGNIEPGSVPPETWPTLAAVLTTNLYGLPDRVVDLSDRCRKLGIPLIEDAAHAIETVVDGQPIGTFGDVAAFSLSKHLGVGAGGVLAFTDEAARADLERLRDRSVGGPGQLRERAVWAATYRTKALVRGLHLVRPARRLRRALGSSERDGYRMALRPIELHAASRVAPAVEPFHRWLRVDLHHYRLPPSKPLLELALTRLRGLDADRARRVEGVARLRDRPDVAAAARRGEPQALFRVPLLVDDREALIARLRSRVVSAGGYIYDPPLDDYAGAEFAEPSPTPDPARWWSGRVFPVDPLEADQVLRHMP